MNMINVYDGKDLSKMTDIELIEYLLTVEQVFIIGEGENIVFSGEITDIVDFD